MKRRYFIKNFSFFAMFGPGLRINRTGKKATINKPGKGATVKINEPPPPPPELGAPVLSLAVISETQINATWTAVENATNYLLQRSPNGVDSWTTIYSGTNLFYNNGSLTGSTTYYYRVYSEAAGYTSGISSINSATTPVSTADAPVILRMTCSTDGTKINILMDRDMNSVTGEHVNFSWKQNEVSRTFTAATLVSNRTIQLTTSHTIAGGDVIVITYVPGNVQSTETGLLTEMSDANVRNCVTLSTFPFFENWEFLLDSRDTSKLVMSGSNITRVFDASGSGRFFEVQATGYATYDAGESAIVVTNGSTNEYATELEVRKPISGRFTVGFKFQTPAAGDPTAVNALNFLRHVPKGDLITSGWNAAISRRNMRVFTTADYWAANIAQSTITNNGGWHYVVATYDGTTYKMWCDGIYVARSVTISSHEIFNRLFQANTSRANHKMKILCMGEYISDADVTTLNTELAAA